VLTAQTVVVAPVPDPQKRLRCECGCLVPVHIFDYASEEFYGCQVCDDCPSMGRFFPKAEAR
jgi:hypothetical protein